MKKFQNKRKHSEAQANAHQKADYLNELIWWVIENARPIRHELICGSQQPVKTASLVHHIMISIFDEVSNDTLVIGLKKSTVRKGSWTQKNTMINKIVCEQKQGRNAQHRFRPSRRWVMCHFSTNQMVDCRDTSPNRLMGKTLWPITTRLDSASFSRPLNFKHLKRRGLMGPPQ